MNNNIKIQNKALNEIHTYSSMDDMIKKMQDTMLELNKYSHSGYDINMRTFNKIIRPMGVKLTSMGTYYVWEGLTEKMQDHLAQLYTNSVYTYRFNDRDNFQWVSEFQSMMAGTDEYSDHSLLAVTDYIAQWGNLKAYKLNRLEDENDEGEKVFINVYVNLWFDDVNGNTYHSCECKHKGAIYHTGMKYGYGTQYKQSFKDLTSSMFKGHRFWKDYEPHYIVKYVDKKEQLYANTSHYDQNGNFTQQLKTYSREEVVANQKERLEKTEKMTKGALQFLEDYSKEDVIKLIEFVKDNHSNVNWDDVIRKVVQANTLEKIEYCNELDINDSDCILCAGNHGDNTYCQM